MGIRMLIQNGMVFTGGTRFERTDIEICKDCISRLAVTADRESAASCGDIYDAAGCYVIPGLIDLHFHGCDGSDISDHREEGLARIAAYELQNGITAICPATMTLPEEELAAVLSMAKAYQNSPSGYEMPGAELVGIHLEGPFLSKEKRGAQNSDYIQSPDAAFLNRLTKAAPGLVKLITVAPELPGADALISGAAREFVISLGHSTADYQTARRAFTLGARHVTHLFNAMSPFAHRDTGIAGAAFDDQRVHVELICDGIHVSDSMIRAAFQLYTDDRILLISDSMRAAGMPDGSYTLGGQQVTVRGRLALLADGTIAGSVTNLMDCLRYAVKHAGIPLESALKAATINPARELGLGEKYGQIAPGSYADLVILDADLTIRDILFRGRVL